MLEEIKELSVEDLKEIARVYSESLHPSIEEAKRAAYAYLIGADLLRGTAGLSMKLVGSVVEQGRGKDLSIMEKAYIAMAADAFLLGLQSYKAIDQAHTLALVAPMGLTAYPWVFNDDLTTEAIFEHVTTLSKETPIARNNDQTEPTPKLSKGARKVQEAAASIASIDVEELRKVFVEPEPEEVEPPVVGAVPEITLDLFGAKK